MHNKISAVILTHNNQKTIEKCIQSVFSVVDEIIIIDDYSSDKTLDILSSYEKTRVFQRKLDNDFASQRNYGIDLAKNKFILTIDSDEFISDELIKSLKETSLSDKKNYIVFRKNINFHGGCDVLLKDRPFITTKNNKFKNALHERIEFNERYILDGLIIHDCWINLSDFVNDINVYSERKARIWIKEGRSYGCFRLAIRQVLAFMYQFAKRFFWEKRLFHGSKAFMYCLFWASEEILVGMKYIEIKERNKRAN